MSRRKTIIIAEIGPNHNGSISIAKKLILEAKKSGADYVKFQTYKTEEVLIKNLKKANYQINNTRNKSETQFEMLKKFELSYKNFNILQLVTKTLSIFASVTNLSNHFKN
jgi:sialic acid synthase SpsE